MNPSEAIERLIASGMTEAAIGLAVGGVRQSTINKIKRGVVPNWETGMRLVELANGLPPDEDHPDARRSSAANGDAADDSTSALKNAA